MKVEPADVPVFLLCGGLGTRMKEETEFKPKPMIEVGGAPIVSHIMGSYAAYGFRRFVLCLGFRADYVKNYFLNRRYLASDFLLMPDAREPEFLAAEDGPDWEIHLVDTGAKSMTGSRVAQAFDRYYSEFEHFAVTYGDGLCDVDLGAEFAFHLEHEALGTILGVNPVSRFGQIKAEGDVVEEFLEKPVLTDDWINGGYFFFRSGFRRYLDSGGSCILERDPLCKLSADGELRVFRHSGFWTCMDTQRDKEDLEGKFARGELSWLQQQQGSRKEKK